MQSYASITHTVHPHLATRVSTRNVHLSDSLQQVIVLSKPTGGSETITANEIWPCFKLLSFTLFSHFFCQCSFIHVFYDFSIFLSNTKLANIDPSAHIHLHIYLCLFPPLSACINKSGKWSRKKNLVEMTFALSPATRSRSLHGIPEESEFQLRLQQQTSSFGHFFLGVYRNRTLVR